MDLKTKNAVFVAMTSWTLDTFDFFILVFVLKDIAVSFNVTVQEVSLAVFLTLAVRSISALVFGRMAEKVGRKPVLINNIIIFSILEAASALAPTLFIFIAIHCILCWALVHFLCNLWYKVFEA